ncbi:hypothetical protein ACFX1S_000749 [Malus domestica]
MVVEVGEPRSERSTRDVVLDQPIHVDDGGDVAELNVGERDSFKAECEKLKSEFQSPFTAPEDARIKF